MDKDKEIKRLKERIKKLEQMETERLSAEQVGKQVEDQLHRTQQELDTIFNSDPVAIWYKDKENNIIRVNKAGAASVGRKIEDINGKPVKEIFPEADAELYFKDDLEVMESGKSKLNIVERMETASGERKWVSTDKVPYCDVDGNVLGVIAFVTDITERKQTEEALHESNRILAQAQQIAHIGSWVWDIETGKVTWSDELFNIYGLDKEKDADSLSVELIQQMTHPDDMEIVLKNAEAAFKEGRVQPIEYRIIRPDKTERIVHGESASNLGKKQKPTRVVGVIQDITERKKAEEALKESEKLFSEFFNQGNIGAVITSLKKGFIRTNQKFQDLLGYTEKELKKKTWAEMTHPEDLAADVKLHNKLLAGKINNYELDKRFFRKDGSTLYSHITVTCNRNSDGSPKHMLATLQDTTEKNKTEEAMKESEERYRSLVESTEDSIYLISRDLTYLYANAKVLSRLRCSIDELIGAEYGKFHSAQGVSQFSEIIKQIFETGKSLVYEYQSERDQHYFLRTLSPVINPETKAVIAITIISKDITERKRAEEKLEKSENLLANIIDQSPFSTWIADANGTNIRQNAACRKLFGIDSDDQTVGKYNLFKDPVIKAQGHLEKIEMVFKEGKTARIIIDYDFSLVDHVDVPHATHTSLDVTIFPIKDAEGRVVNVVVQHDDITERKQAEEALRIERDNLINIFEAMEDGVYIVNQQYDIQYVNPVLEKDFGICKGRKCYEYFQDRKEVCPWCKNSDVFAGKTVRWEWYSFKNQKKYDLIDTPLKNPDGSISKLEIFRDITERKQAEETLKQKMHQLDRANRLMVDRELKMIQLKKELNELLVKAGSPQKYSSPDKVKELRP